MWLGTTGPVLDVSPRYFEVMLSTLTLEEIIALRLELASLYINNKLYNFPIYKSIKYITKDLNFPLLAFLRF